MAAEARDGTLICFGIVAGVEGPNFGTHHSWPTWCYIWITEMLLACFLLPRWWLTGRYYNTACGERAIQARKRFSWGTQEAPYSLI